MPREAPSVGRDEREDKAAAKGGDKCPAWSMSVSARNAPRRQSTRFHTTERQISPPSTQPAVVSVSPASVIVPE